MKKKWLIYGANGYTGRLIARQARQQGLKPVLAGRNKEGVAGIAAETGFDSLVFDPCGNAPDQGDFLSVMRQNIENLKLAFL